MLSEYLLVICTKLHGSMLSQWIEICTYSDPSCVFRPLLLDSLAKPPELIDLHCGYLCLYLRVRPFTVDQCVDTGAPG